MDLNRNVGQFEGVGVEAEMKGSNLIIVALPEGTPAQQGLRP
jgi:hypothetical protein